MAKAPKSTPPPNFGEVLKRLRTDRGMTQVELAAAAGVSDFTIQRGEKSAAAPWKRGTTVEVFEALRDKHPVSEPDARAYFAAAGMQPLIDEAAAIAARRPRAGSAEDRALAEELARRQTARAWLEVLLDELDEERVLAALRSIADLAGVRLPPLGARPSTPPPSSSSLPSAAAVGAAAAFKAGSVTEYHPPPGRQPKPAEKPATRRSAT